MNWDCTDTEERLSDFLDETLSEEEAAAFSAHAAGCAKCAQLVAQVGGLVAADAPDRAGRNAGTAGVGDS